MWFVFVMSFGNMAVSLYVILQVVKLPGGTGLSEILTMRTEPVSVSRHGQD